MQFVPFEPEIEVSGASIYAMFEAFGAFRLLASRILLEEGLGRADARGRATIDCGAWYPQAAILRALQRISTQMGDEALHLVGQHLPQRVSFPDAGDVESALRSVDVVYHLNHHKAGLAMFDSATGAMLEGIGHYGCERLGAQQVRAVCETPYPCAFEQGLLGAVAARHAATARVEHEADRPCRKRGDERCAYRISW